MDAGDLRVFESVARLGGMNRAAEELNTVQSNVTSRVRLLEQRLGVALFHRHSRGVTLTEHGQRLLPYAIKVAHILDEARRAVEDDGKPKGQLRIGSLETTAAYRLPPIITTYGKCYSDVAFTLKTATNLELVEAILANKLDGAFVCGPVAHPEIQQDQIFREELVIATAFRRNKFDSLDDSGRLKILVKGPGCAYREHFERMLERTGVSFSRMEFGTLDAIVGCTSAGLGETMLPESVLINAVQGKRVSIHRLPPSDSMVDTVFIKRKDTLITSALAAFLETALSHSCLLHAAE